MEPETNAPGIFIVEDEALVAREIRSRLTQMGHRVVGMAHSYDQALERIRESQPDLLLLDINLKHEMDGVDVAKVIQAERDIPVIFLTAYSDVETVAKAKSVMPFGYIIKPVENRELQIALEIALYKHRVERELRETKELLANALHCIGNALVFIDARGTITNLNDDAQEVFGWPRQEAIGSSWASFLKVDRETNLQPVRKLIDKAIKSEGVTRLSPFLAYDNAGSQLLLDGIIGPIGQEQARGSVMILRELAEISDPVERMPMPRELMLGPDAKGVLLSQSSFVLLLIRPDNIGETVERLGAENEDRLIRDIAATLNRSLRSTDLASLFAGAIFSASLPYTSLEEGQRIADAILRSLSDHAFLDGNTYLTFSIGLAHSDPGQHQDSPLELFRRANWALNVAKESGGSRVVTWNPNVEIEVVGNLDRQSEMFSPNAGRDYRNMLLLWNTMSIIGRALPLEELVEKLVTNLHRSFDMDSVAFFGWHDGELRLYCECGPTGVCQYELEAMLLSERHVALLHEMMSSTVRRNFETSKDKSGVAYFVPLTREQHPGVFYLHRKEGSSLRDKDLLFIKTLVDYFAIPYESALAALHASTEVDEENDSPYRMLYQSRKMIDIMDQIELVAPTDATVLITGESGTGKELIARTIHDRSSRRDNRFIIVDCGAIVESLLESELFGHTRGAFTGADRNEPGRLKEADGGTVLLDEIGDLPMDMQVKLLRFVEERQLIPVGSSQYEKVDTRVIAATHRNLESAVRAGEFREDLYYRLKVFSLHAPPLRERREDIMMLAHRYLHRYSLQYGKKISGFTLDAETALTEYDWPGNVREMINVINRSVILCQDRQVNTIHLGLFPRESETGAAPRGDHATGIGGARPLQPEVLDRTFAVEVERFIRRCLDLHLPLPIGTWLEEDLILASMAANDQVVLRAATALSLPESTLRRKISKMREQHRGRVPDRPPEWEPIQALVSQLISVAAVQDQPAIDYSLRILLRQIGEQTNSRAEGARLVGVSGPTFKKMVDELL